MTKIIKSPVCCYIPEIEQYFKQATVIQLVTTVPVAAVSIDTEYFIFNSCKIAAILRAHTVKDNLFFLISTRKSN